MRGGGGGKDFYNILGLQRNANESEIKNLSFANPRNSKLSARLPAGSPTISTTFSPASRVTPISSDSIYQNTTLPRSMSVSLKMRREGLPIS